MILRKLLHISTAVIVVSSSVSSAVAGQLYRFPDDQGVPTLSRSMPPEAAQRGYEIIDDKTFRLIERVPPALSEQELLEMKAREEEEAEQRRLADLAAKEAQKRQELQARYDRTLLITYSTEADLIAARDRDLGYREEQIELLSGKLPTLRQNLEVVQKEAADRELSGGKVTENMQKRLNAAQEEIQVREQAIRLYQQEIEELTAKYTYDLERFKTLHGNR